MRKIIFIFCLLSCSISLAISDIFPPTAPTAPIPADYLPSPAHTYYCSPTGNNTTGVGSEANPWLDLIGAASGGAGTPIAAGDLLYFRGGTYPSYSLVNFSRSQNILSIDGTAENPIVLTNYPGEIAVWDDQVIWSMTLDGEYQYLVATDVEGVKGIKFVGGISWREDHIKIINCEFVTGTSNGGDLNPAMISQPLNDNYYTGAEISYNYMHDSVCIDSAGNPGSCSGSVKMSVIRLFTTDNLVIQYNLFEDNIISDGGVVYFKDASTDATVKYNKFISNTTASYGNVVFYGQDVSRPSCDGLDIYGNLFYGGTYAFGYRNEYTPGLRIYNNVVLNTTGIYYYLNSENETDGPDNGEVYDNIFDGLAFIEGWHSNSSVLDHLPTLWDYNLYYSSDQQNTPSGWSLPSGYYDHAVVENNAVTYNSTTMTATVADDYAGLGTGRDGGNIGGFEWSADETAPTLSSGAVNGTNWTVTHSETVSGEPTSGSYYANCGGDDIDLTYVSGSGSATYLFTSLTAAVYDQTCTVKFDDSGAGEVNDGTNDLAVDTTGIEVTNNTGPVGNDNKGSGKTFNSLGSGVSFNASGSGKIFSN